MRLLFASIILLATSATAFAQEFSNFSAGPSSGFPVSLSAHQENLGGDVKNWIGVSNGALSVERNDEQALYRMHLNGNVGNLFGVKKSWMNYFRVDAQAGYGLPEAVAFGAYDSWGKFGMYAGGVYTKIGKLQPLLAPKYDWSDRCSTEVVFFQDKRGEGVSDIYTVALNAKARVFEKVYAKAGVIEKMNSEKNKTGYSAGLARGPLSVYVEQIPYWQGGEVTNNKFGAQVSFPL